MSRTFRTHRRSVQVEAVAPWAALTVILLLWWGGAKTITWMRSPATPSSSAVVVRAGTTARAIDESAPKEATLSATPKHNDEATLSADVSVTGQDIANLRGRDLLIPVRGLQASGLVSSFTDARTGHVHEAIDILAPRGTEVLAVERGRIAKFFTSVAGGLTIYEFDSNGAYVYYYAHLDSYASGVKEGDEVERGQVLGYVGTTGNAPKNTPHLHFGISKLGADQRWWGGTALDPFLVWRDPRS